MKGMLGGMPVRMETGSDGKVRNRVRKRPARQGKHEGENGQHGPEGRVENGQHGEWLAGRRTVGADA